MSSSAKKGKKWVLVTDGTESPESDSIQGFLFSRDSKRNDTIWLGSLSFTGDSSIAYIAREGRRFHRVRQQPGS